MTIKSHLPTRKGRGEGTSLLSFLRKQESSVFILTNERKTKDAGFL